MVRSYLEVTDVVLTRTDIRVKENIPGREAVPVEGQGSTEL